MLALRYLRPNFSIKGVVGFMICFWECRRAGLAEYLEKELDMPKTFVVSRSSLPLSAEQGSESEHGNKSDLV